MVKGFQSKTYVMVKEVKNVSIKAFSSKLSCKGYSSKNATVQCIIYMSKVQRLKLAIK